MSLFFWLVIVVKSEILETAPKILKGFLGYLQTVRGKSIKTVEEYFCDLRTFFRYLKIKQGKFTKNDDFSKIPIDDIDIDDIKKINLTIVYEYVNYLAEERENGAASRSRKVSSLRTFFKYLTHKANLLETNPVEQLETPKLSKTLPKFLSFEQSKKLLETVLNSPSEFKERDYCIITLFLNCGMRLSELAGINLRDIGDDSTLKIRGKGDKERMIYLNHACTSAIENYMKVRPRDGVKDKDALFISRLKNRMSVKTIQFMVNNYLSSAGLANTGCTVHKLRHTAATLMYQHGDVDIRVLKDILGHENLGTTEIYTHLASKQVQEAMKSNPLAEIEAD